MTSISESHDPASVDVRKVRPAPGLGASFDVVALPALSLSGKARIWGEPDTDAIEPTVPAFIQQDLKRKTLQKESFRCMFCGFQSQDNQVHNLNDNHLDTGPANLRAADPLCHGWQHLGEHGDGKAVLAYLPGLTGQDINHLQRTIMIALQSADAGLQADAHTLLNWLGSHRQYTGQVWGTSEPSVFAEALTRPDGSNPDTRALVFENLALIFNPEPYAHHAAVWATQAATTTPAGKWNQVYHDVMNAPT